MTGTGETLFSPGGKMARGMLVTVLHRMLRFVEVQNGNVFTDVGNGDYCAAVCGGTQTGIVNGYRNTSFGPRNFVTREQIAVLPYRYAEHMGASTTFSGGTDLSAFADGDEGSSYTEEAVLWTVDNGLLTGYENGRLSPKGLATRAEVATILMRFIEG